MTESPNAADAKRIVDDLEEDIVDVDKAAGDQELAGEDDEQAAEEQSGGAGDVTDEVPDAPEPAD